ncbi:MAG: hypothetical protein KDA50_09950 [Rhodobacteraceae bacterium]|nr:hypothetical protein [Paracoccaceae bacterium]
MTDHLPQSRGWTATELKALLGAILAVVLWGGAWALLGFAGLIIPALALVFLVFVMLIWISRG